jgi:hypothetical protein
MNLYYSGLKGVKDELAKLDCTSEDVKSGPNNQLSTAKASHDPPHTELIADQ